MEVVWGESGWVLENSKILPPLSLRKGEETVSKQSYQISNTVLYFKGSRPWKSPLARVKNQRFSAIFLPLNCRYLKKTLRCEESRPTVLPETRENQVFQLDV